MSNERTRFAHREADAKGGGAFVFCGATQGAAVQKANAKAYEEIEGCAGQQLTAGKPLIEEGRVR